MMQFCLINTIIIKTKNILNQQDNIEEMNNQQNTQLLSSELLQNPGKILLNSVVKLTETGEDLPCQICERCLIINRVQCIVYSFDVKFIATQGKIIFELFEQTANFILPHNDHSSWRNILKDHLNQKGFHQDFKPIKKIGKGNFASVYLAEKNSDLKRYAVKAFSKEAAFSEQHGKECLIKQIQIMRHLNSKNNMKLHQVYESDNSLYIVFELLEGGQLYDKIKAKQNFTADQVRVMVKGLLEGLKEMHSKKIMHRDLKPQNILFRKENDYDCVIADYGLAEFAEQQKYLFVRCGTPGYVAPEVINIKDMKARYSPICDIFSLGLIFHFLLKGKSAFKGSSYNEVLSQNRACDFDLETPQYNSLPRQALDLMKKMLRKNPQQRINAKQALAHPYFRASLQLEQQMEGLKLSDLQNKGNMNQTEDYALGKWHRNSSQIQKDSCLKLQRGKDSIVNGKTQTVTSVKSTKISFTGQVNRKDKMSKFVRAQGDHS